MHKIRFLNENGRNWLIQRLFPVRSGAVALEKLAPLVIYTEGHSSGIQSVAFNSDGALLATGNEDNTAKVWDVATGEELLTLPGSGGGVKDVAFSPSDDGAHLAVASADGVVHLFLLRIDDLLALAQSRVTRSLTTFECQKYLHVDECPAP